MKRIAPFVLMLVGFAASLAFAGSVTITLGGTPVVITTTAADDAAITGKLAAVNAAISRQNVPVQAENDATLASWNAENVRRAALVPPLAPLPAPTLRPLAALYTAEQVVAERIAEIVTGLVQEHAAKTEATLLGAGRACLAAGKTFSASRDAQGRPTGTCQ